MKKYKKDYKIIKKRKMIKENFFKILNNLPIYDDEESREIMKSLNSMSEEDKKIVKIQIIKL